MNPAFLCAPGVLKRSRTALPSSSHRIKCALPSPESLQSKVESELLISEQTPSFSPPAPHPPRALPVQLDLLNYHARTYSRRAKTRPAALRLYRRCLALNPSDGRAHLGIARLHIANGDIPAARDTFYRGTNVSRKNPHLLQAWGVMEERQGATNRARELYEEALRADPGHAATWVAMGLWWRRVGKNFAKAREMFRRGTQVAPNNYYLWHCWGMLERDCKRYKLARECFRRGVEANPNNAATYVNWGCLEDTCGNTEVAIKLFKKAHIANPRNTHAYVAHAVTAERIGEVQKAISLLQTAIEIRPWDAGARQMLGLVEWRRGSVEKARYYFKDALRVNDRHGPSWHAWARMEQELGFLDRARELYQEAVWATPREQQVVRTWHAWAVLEMYDNNIELARRYFAYGLEIDDSCVPLWCGLAVLEAENSNMSRARDCLEKAVRLIPEFKSTWRLYEQLEREFGSAKQARHVFERSVVVTSQQDHRLVVSDPLPGDFKAGGMWLDPLELKPTESAFESVWESKRGFNIGLGQRIRRDEGNLM